ncbi:MAG: hypothetical protein A2104_06465 [Candidatus Melainabacteria bacterium GWF2_32_7]|nr:MAG: hypothetical protein A2104_06465 [Candidatus Melainabacteria bacterium GWF2_32_7]
MIKVSDYIVNKLARYGIKHVFMISGGGAMHLNDSFGKCTDIQYICNHHEQASAMAAEGYARVNQKLGVVCVTTGPGGINALNGVFGQWTDSVPVLYISGQVKNETTLSSCPELNLRQLGDQEVDIVNVVKHIIKYAEIVKNPYEIGRVLDKAIYIATHGRPGPVWIDVPIDVQAAMVNEAHLIRYDKFEDAINTNITELKSKIDEIIELLKISKRPVIIAGHGIRISNAQGILFEILEKLKIPVVTTINGFDLIPSNNNLFAGRIGTVATRSGNFALQNSDLVISIGSRNNVRQISYNWEYFARAAKKVLIDIDPTELKKPTISPDIAINADAGDFLTAFKKRIEKIQLPSWQNWIEWTKKRKELYPVVLPEYKELTESVHPYYFMEILSKCYKDNTLTVAGNGTAFLVMFQAGIVKKNQRFIWNSGNASMGYDLPAAIGACFANNKKDIICLAGDGSIMMNIQELQTIYHYQLPIKLFILNNDGYISIKQTQTNFFDGRLTACSKESGVSMPDFIKIAEAFNLSTVKIETQHNLEEQIRSILNTPGPVICEVKLTPDYIFSPKLTSEHLPDGKMISKPLEDMYPFLDREEFKSNMLIPEAYNG